MSFFTNVKCLLILKIYSTKFIKIGFYGIIENKLIFVVNLPLFFFYIVDVFTSPIEEIP